MNKTSIEWVKNPDGSQGYTWNPITGCLNHNNGLCKGGGFPCYAYKLAHGRLKPLYLANHNVSAPCLAGREIDKAMNDPFYPRFWEERLKEPVRGYHHTDWYGHCEFGASPKGIFVCDMSDLFGIGIPEEWTSRVLKVIKSWDNRLDRFYLLTKQPQNLIKFNPFPENCFVGVTVTNQHANCSANLSDSLRALIDIDAKVKFVSFEPLLEEINVSFYPDEIQWLIVGACTGSESGIGKVQRKYPELSHKPYKNQWTAQPRIEDLREIVEAADKAGIRVFLKDNLRPLLIPEDGSKPNYLLEDIFWASEKAQLRQEMPE